MSTLVPDEISMEDPLCDSSFGSMVTLDYVNLLTACAPQESGIFSSDFAAAYRSVHHSWTFSVIENSGLPSFYLPLPSGQSEGQHHTRGTCGSTTRTIRDG